RDAGLQPRSVMERGVPVVHGSVIAPERELREIVPVVANDRALEIDVVDTRCRSEADFREITDFWRKGGSKVQHELPKLESAVYSTRIVSPEVNVRESSDLEVRVFLASPRQHGVHAFHLFRLHRRGASLRL